MEAATHLNFGPFCVSMHDGTMRAVATGQKCYHVKTVRDGVLYWPERRIAH